jgi:ribosomal protein S18
MMLTKTKISDVAVASAVILATSPNNTVGDTEFAAPIDSRSVLTDVETVGEANVENLDVSLHVEVASSELKWTARDSRKFEALVSKRAFLEASADEDREFEQLQQLKRAVLAVASGTDALNEYRRRRFVSDLLKVLNRNATFFTAKDQKRLRAIGKAARS